MQHLVIPKCSEVDTYFRNMLTSGGVNLSSDDTLVLRSEELLPQGDLENLIHPEGTYKYNILVLRDDETYDQYLKRMTHNDLLRKSYERFNHKAVRKLKNSGWI